MPRKRRGDAPVKIVEVARENRRKLTTAEMRLWNALRGRRVAGLKFRLQHPFGQFVLDFFCLERNLAVEVDGGSHNEPGQKEYDADRTQYLNDQGIRVLRFRNEEVLANLDQVLSQIIKATED